MSDSTNENTETHEDMLTRFSMIEIDDDGDTTIVTTTKAAPEGPALPVGVAVETVPSLEDLGRRAPTPAPYVAPVEATALIEAPTVTRDIFVEATDGDPYVGRRIQWGLTGQVSIAALRAAAPAWFLSMLPEEVTPRAALTKAVLAMTKEKGVFHEKHPKGGWAICTVRPTTGKETLEFGVKFRLFLDENGQVQGESEGMPEGELLSMVSLVRLKMASELTRELDTTEISMLLTRSVERLGGIPTVRRGSYYIPPAGVAAWEALVACFDACSSHYLESAGVIRTDKRFFARLTFDTMAAFEGRLTEMGEELQGEVGKKSVGARLVELDGMKAKAESYKRILGVGIDGILAKISDMRGKYSAHATRGALLEI